MNDNIYITGHRHPDSDSICSAIALANLYNLTGKSAIACRQGPLNEETKYILKKFDLENPLLLTDARMTLADIDLDEPTLISKDETVHHAWHIMLRTQNRSLIVVDEKENLCGICTTSNLSRVRIHPDTDLNSLMSTATVFNIAKTIGGQVIYEPDVFKTNGIIRIITLDEINSKDYPVKDSICILSSRKDKQELLINEGAKCLVITCGIEIDEEIKELAKKNNCALIATKNDTMHVARVITESYSIENIMTKDILSFEENEYVDEVASKMRSSRVRSYPVLNKEGKIVGAISRYHTRNYKKRKVVLVDHSASNQSIHHVESADIIAIVDHHHIGDIQTTMPIEFRNHRRGCTCTIIYQLYLENNVEVSSQMAGIMLSAILSDTLNLKSTTTTKYDIDAVKQLAKIANIDDIDEYAREMLGASVSLLDSKPSDILNRDLKYYQIAKYNIAIGQTNYSKIADVQKILPVFKENMETELASKDLDLLVMLFTDVMGEGSTFVYYGALSYLVGEIIETEYDEHSGFDSNIISRKQQLMPVLSEKIESLL